MNPTLLTSPGIPGNAAAPEGAQCPLPGDQSPQPQGSGAGWTGTAPSRLGEPLNPSSNQCPALAGRCVRGTWEQGEGLKFLLETARSLTWLVGKEMCCRQGAGAAILPKGRDTNPGAAAQETPKCFPPQLKRVADSPPWAFSLILFKNKTQGTHVQL